LYYPSCRYRELAETSCLTDASKKVKKEGAKANESSSSSSSDEEIGRGENTQRVDPRTGVAQPTGAAQPINTTTVV
jgi:hypothetical protein